MRVLVLGGAGMLGHKIYQQLKQGFDVYATVRQPISYYSKYNLFDEDTCIPEVDVLDFESFDRTLEAIRPSAIINCIGLTTRKIEGQATSKVILVNSWLPHRLTQWCQDNNSRLIHFSTDCVFSGQRGPYATNDLKDAQDLYGLSKSLGEVTEAPALTLRSSIIGRELSGNTELVEWLLSQEGQEIKGFSKVMYSGVTTVQMAKLVEQILTEHSNLHGLFQVASPGISKYSLLTKIRDHLELNIQINDDPSKVSNKILDSGGFTQTTGITIPDWDTMINEMFEDHSYYQEIKS